MADESHDAYRDAGVDLEAAEESVRRYTSLVEETRTPGVLGEVGGFGGLFSLLDAGIDLGEGSDPVLVSGTDGVGTKLKLAFTLGRHDTIGIDCVAMCVNDVATTGARPLFFLDYLATGRLDPDQAASVVSGIARGCKLADCALIGGETAEMPGFYTDGEYDIAGFCVGIADRGELLRPEDVEPGHAILGVASSGFHSNGFSLIRKIIDDARLEVDSEYPELSSDTTLGDALLEPTLLYVDALRRLIEHCDVRTCAHVTGGGFYENLPRALPDGLGAVIDPSSWEVPRVIDFVVERSGVSRHEAHRVFNMGIGLAVILPGDDVSRAIDVLDGIGLRSWEIGRVEGSTVTLEGID